MEITTCSIQDGGHCWFGSDDCRTGSPVGTAVVGNNSNFMKNTDVIWSFFARHAR